MKKLTSVASIVDVLPSAGVISRLPSSVCPPLCTPGSTLNPLSTLLRVNRQHPLLLTCCSPTLDNVYKFHICLLPLAMVSVLLTRSVWHWFYHLSKLNSLPSHMHLLLICAASETLLKYTAAGHTYTHTDTARHILSQLPCTYASVKTSFNGLYTQPPPATWNKYGEHATLPSALTLYSHTQIRKQPSCFYFLHTGRLELKYIEA